ncbi:MAG: A/G-specific adenine glycosylase [Spirochaetaceae bacterium]|nr:A/G-specific adenine glycosylase [Spirochaetaceae bacterium]
MSDIVRFRRRVLDHYRRHGRRFPWRQTRDPYRILVSEFMLQQTQTARVLGHYEPFVARFPEARSLAAADRGEVLALWSGLGYNRRAVALHRAAALIANRFGGEVPSGEEDLRALPGVGPATAGAVQAFGFGLPAVFVETNIRRAVLHELFGGRDQVSDRELEPVLERALDRADPRTWYQALMDYGAALGRGGPNPNRRSAHYTRQSRFDGSNRQQRGLILRVLAERGPLNRDELAAAIGATDRAGRDRARRNLDAMAAEGFLDMTGRMVALTTGRREP